MKKLLKLIKSRVESTLGITIRRKAYTPPVNFRDQPAHPAALLYRSTLASGTFMARMDKGRGLLGYSLRPGDGHPFVEALCVARGQPREEALVRISGVLKTFYDSFQPQSAAQYLGLDESANPKLADAPAWAYVFPWVSQSVEQRLGQKRREPKSARPGTYQADLPIALGWKNCGPASDLLVANEADRLERVMRSVEENGFQRHDGEGGDILASAFVDESGRWCWHIGSGQHRAAAMAALGHDEVVVRINNLVYRKDVDSWPQVMNGTYTKQSALALFDRIFAGI